MSISSRQDGATFPVELIDKHLDNVLKASGSGLRYYSLPGNVEKMRKAMADAMNEAREAQS